MKKLIVFMLVLCLLPVAAQAQELQGGYYQLTADLNAQISLTEDLYIDLNGHNLTGTLITNGYKVYGMDSTTDGYTCDSIGYFNCVDENGNAVEPQSHFRSDITGTMKRYMTVKTAEGYSFHRFYLGITHQSLKPTTTAVGYKAAFYADAMAAARIESYGYTLQLDTYLPKTVTMAGSSFVSGQTVTLRVENYDVENYGQTNLYASVMLELTDGTYIESNRCTMTLRSLLEAVDEKYADLTDTQVEQAVALIREHEIMQTWNIPNLLAHMSGPKEMTYEEFIALSPAEQMAYQDSFGEGLEGLQAFFDWYNAAKAKYEAENPPIDIGGGGDVVLP